MAVSLLAMLSQNVSAQTPIWPEGASPVIPYISDVFSETNNDPATYEQVIMMNDTVINQLISLEASSGGLLKVGPLLQYGNSGSLFETDLALLLQINNTLNDYPGMKIKTDTELLAKMGKSTQGREIWGARMANPGKEKLIINGGLHGNEPLNTPAILNFIAFLLTDAPDAISIRNNFDILFVPRVNVDGGEPSKNCFQGSKNAPGVEPFTDADGDGVVDAGVNCALYRHNVDPRAGTAIAGENLAGLGVLQVVKGQGWDLNRYMHTYMDKPIFPIEGRLMVYVLNKFYGAIPVNSATARRGTILDMHQKGPQIACKPPTGTGPIAIRVPDTDPKYHLMMTLLLQPAAECVDNSLATFLEGTINPGAASVLSINQPAENLSAQRIASETITNVNSVTYEGRPFSVGRFSQSAATYGANTKTITQGARLMGIQAFTIETEGMGMPLFNYEVPSLFTTGSNGLLWNNQRYTALPQAVMKAYLLGIINGKRDDTSLGDNGFSLQALPTFDVSFGFPDLSHALSNTITSWNTYWQTNTGASCTALGYYPISPLPTPSSSFKCFQDNAIFPIPTSGINTTCVVSNCGPAGSLQRSKVTPSSFSNSLTPPASDTKTLTIANTDTAISSLTWTVSDCTVGGTQAWLSIGQASGTTGALQTTNVSLSISSAGQSYGQHNATLCVTTNDASHPTWQIPVSMFVEDHIGPAITINPPLDGAQYLLNQNVTANYSCADEALGSGLLSCVGNVPNGMLLTNAVGTYSVKVDASDNAGNTSAKTNTYKVGYDLGAGFLAPIDNPPMGNSGKAGRTYPVKFILKDANGVVITNTAAVKSILYQPVGCISGVTTDPLPTDSTAPSTALRFDGTQFIFNWQTPSTKTCYNLLVNLNSGQVLPAYFDLSK